ncbi:MAG: Histidine decarboxylase [Ignavibacteriaceae bacterium]|nr:Histidine decarboxylase [Ignavibacteriaceae bacterium]
MNTIDLKTLFLGPKGGNKSLLLDLVSEIVNDHVFWRKNFHPEDPPIIRETDKIKSEYYSSVSILKDELNGVLADLRNSIPFFSPRYIAHMNSDILIPAILGYFSAVLCNPNNVTSESSPVTTNYEIKVIEELSRLLSFDLKLAAGHITSGGTIANYESLWIARNLKYLPLAIKSVCSKENIVIEIDLIDGQRKKISDMTEWELFNIDVKNIIDLRESVVSKLSSKGYNDKKIDEIFSKSEFAISMNGLNNVVPSKVITSSTAHYSWDKAVDLLGIGKNNMVKINVNEHFRIDIYELERYLHEALKNQIPIISVIAVFGSTEEGAVDNIDKIIALRSKYRKLGLGFYLHIDAAYGGYARSIFLNEEYKVKPSDSILKSYDWPCKEVYEAQRYLNEADGITIDPHKLGYIPYPAGAIVYRDKAFSKIISVNAPYIIHTQSNQDTNGNIFIGEHILEGSKPGASAAAIYLANRILPLNSQGYGYLIGESIKGVQQIYLKLMSNVEVEIDKDIFIEIKPLTRPDLNILCFIVNKKGNYYLDKMNDLNNLIYEKFTYGRSNPIPAHKFFISKTEFNYDIYYESVIPILSALGIDITQYRTEIKKVTILRITLMHPWYEVQEEMNIASEFYGELIKSIREIKRDKPELFY